MNALDLFLGICSLICFLECTWWVNHSMPFTSSVYHSFQCRLLVHSLALTLIQCFDCVLQLCLESYLPMTKRRRSQTSVSGRALASVLRLLTVLAWACQWSSPRLASSWSSRTHCMPLLSDGHIRGSRGFVSLVVFFVLSWSLLCCCRLPVHTSFIFSLFFF